MRKKFYPWSIGLPKQMSISCATLFGLGNFTAPGTWGSFAGALLYMLLFSEMAILSYVVFAALLCYIAVGMCDAAERHLKMRDPGKIILDEFVAMPICFMPIFGQSFSLSGIILGFIFFRFFDIRKPLGIAKLQNLEGGLGCVADDIAAALATCVIINLIAYCLVPGFYAVRKRLLSHADFPPSRRGI